MRLLIIALGIAALTACSAGRPVQQTSVTQIRSQEAVVMAPEFPVGFGQNIAPGMSSLTAVAGLTGAQAPTDNVGQQAIPVHGVLRGAAGVDNGIEVTASGSIGSPNIDPGPVAAAIDDPTGVLGRGTIGMRAFIPTKSAVEIGWSFDVGAEASTYKVNDTFVVYERDRIHGEREDTKVGASVADLRLKPHLRTALLLRAPLPGSLPVSLIGGMQAQNWTVYWAEATRVETCTTYSHGSTDCNVEGSIPKKPSKQVAVWTPTVGASVRTDVATIHLQGFVHLGPSGVDAVPWGGLVSVELFGGQPTEKRESVATNSIPDR